MAGQTLKGRVSNNPTGRPTGSKNKVTIDLRIRINDFLSDNWETLQADFKKLEPKDRLLFYEKLLSFGLPKLQSTKIEDTTKKPFVILNLGSGQSEEIENPDVLKAFELSDD